MAQFLATLLPDAKRLHLQLGPIDLIIGAQGLQADIDAAYGQARQAFDGLLEQLVSELAVLKSPVSKHNLKTTGPVANRMVEAANHFKGQFVTPMAAVAGAVADYILASMTAGRSLEKAYVNNGGDIALYLSGGAQHRVGIVADVHNPKINMTTTITYDHPVRGVASSGWRGRSHSLGIADAVTVLACSAAQADVAATLIANAVDPGPCAQVTREPAQDLSPDSDLAELLVTVNVTNLSNDQIERALARGQHLALDYVERGLIAGVALSLSGRVVSVGEVLTQAKTISPEFINLASKEAVHAPS
ncbi:MAG: UPF0280 family protein [Magnetovibrio sp.]|nr:UPF0280 family protein [Magnetovibrio sp.]